MKLSPRQAAMPRLALPLLALLTFSACDFIAPPPKASSATRPDPMTERYRSDTPMGRFALPPVSPPPAKNAPTGPVRTVKVGLLLPLSGDSQALGNALLDAAMLGLFDKYNSMSEDKKNVQVVLLPKDTEGSTDGAALATKAALQEGAAMFLGPVFSPSVKQAGPVAHGSNVPLLAFSNNPDVAGEGIYLYGFLPEQQVLRVAEEAYRNRLNRIAALVPSNAYGKMVAGALERSAAAHGQKLVGIGYYPEGGEADVAIDTLFSNVQTGAKPEVDAILIAEGGDKLRVIANRLKKVGVTSDNTQFLGTGLWDDPALLSAPELAGGWFAGSPLALTRNFERRFATTYQHQPPRLASLAYDGVALAVTLALNSSDGKITDAALENNVGFAGPANGIFRFQNGNSERGLAVLRLGAKGFDEISPAPRAFK